MDLQEGALAREWELRKARKLVKTDAKGQITDAESRSLYVNWRRVLKPLRADEEAVAAVRKRRNESLLLALENYRLCVLISWLHRCHCSAGCTVSASTTFMQQ